MRCDTDIKIWLCNYPPASLLIPMWGPQTAMPSKSPWLCTARRCWPSMADSGSACNKLIFIRYRYRWFAEQKLICALPLKKKESMKEKSTLKNQLTHCINVEGFKGTFYSAYHLPIIWKECDQCQCCGSEPDIRCFFDPGILDPGWEKNQDLRSGINILDYSFEN
jgi:hypothetical protein